jgi:retron-type reverse transcriptase
VSKKNELSKECRHGIQGDLFAKEQASGMKKGGGTSRKDQKIALISRLEEQRTLTTNTVDKISDQLHLLKAFRRVKGNNGTAGIDGITLGEYERELSANIKQLQIQLKVGTYEPNSVRGVEIEKPNGGTRLLGIPTVGDRVLQQSIQTELQRVFDPFFSENSYGFRPGRSAHQAIERSSEYVKEGKICIYYSKTAPLFSLKVYHLLPT